MAKHSCQFWIIIQIEYTTSEYTHCFLPWQWGSKHSNLVNQTVSIFCCPEQTPQTSSFHFSSRLWAESGNMSKKSVTTAQTQCRQWVSWGYIQSLLPFETFWQCWRLKGPMSWPFLPIIIPLLRSTRIDVHCSMFQNHIGFLIQHLCSVNFGSCFWCSLSL